METRKSPSAVESKFSLSECKMENAMDNGAKNIESVLRDSHSGDQDHHINTPDPSLVDGTNTSPKQSDLSHAVNCTVTIALAVPRGEDETSAAAQTKAKAKRIRLAEAPKAQSFYHVEYCLFPDDPNPVKVDLVMCGLAAKVYMASETKVLKPWQEGDKMWLGWSQSFKLKVTKELLIKMATHKITFHVWDDKDKVSCRVRSDRSFTLPQGRNEEGSRQSGDIKKIVHKLRSMLDMEQARNKSKFNEDYADPTQKGSRKHFDRENVTVKTADAAQSRIAAQKTLQEHLAHAEEVRKSDFASAELHCTYLLAGDLSVTESLVGCSGWAYEGLCNISLDQPLMSDRLKDELNPLVITILAGTSLPSSPVPLHVLQERCLPVYCQYKFPNMDVHKTKGHMHRANIYFRDVNVILSGLLSSAELLEFFKGPPLDIEVHDRDRKVAKPFPGPAVFGSEPQDNKLGSVGLMKLADNPSPQKGQPSDPYGVASLCFSDLLCGEQKVKLNLPIRCSPPSRPGDQRPRCSEKETLAISSSADCSPHMTVPVGHYFDANSQLKVQIEIAHPVGVESITWDGDCPFGRIIYIFKHNSASNLTTLLSEIFRINAAAFRLENTTDGGLSQHKWNVKHRENKDLDVITGFHIFDKCLHLFVLEGLKDQAIKMLFETLPIKNEDEQVTILYNSTLCFSKRLYSALDEGFGTIHLDEPLETIMQQPLVFVRDVLPHTCFKALSRYHLSSAPTKHRGHSLSVLSDVCLFKKANRSSLNVSGRFPLLIYVLVNTLSLLDRTEIACKLSRHFYSNFLCLLLISNVMMFRITNICQVSSLTEVVRNNLFPTAEMVLSLRGHFGTDPGKREENPARSQQIAMEISEQKATGKAYKPLETYNQDYIVWKQHTADQHLHGRTKNYIKANKEEVERTSLMNLKPKPQVIVAELEESRTAHNYSIQAMNSTAQAKELLRKEMAKTTAQRFSYCLDYHSATVDLQDADAERKAEEVRSREAWRTFNGFVYRGFRSSIESNANAKHPDEARVEELRKPWRENILHANVLNPTLDRCRWPWVKRSQDFELYTKPPRVFGPVPPISIHLAGEALHQEQLQAAHAQYQRWLKKVLPDINSSASRRLPEFKCYMKKANLDKQQDILKDPPMKYSLTSGGMNLKPIPVVSVIQQLESREEACIPFAPGPFLNSLSRDHNFIPRHASQYNKYHFRDFWKIHSFRYKRAALPLTEEELRVYCFQKPTRSSQPHPAAGQSQQGSTVNEKKNMTGQTDWPYSALIHNVRKSIQSTKIIYTR
ncbi:uncharacterized protein cfap92 isoform X2 [Denticeps clupeoides]|uniref:uncharacterized protein cfap92 isoform X2 n=1 Tax=Denticeps clupeoides TaxID=299321 RepID=UPI0010A3D2E9|nr:uncharacterized protein KIAA1257 homolog isoform X2 [Denticeps clupeoides]